MYIDHNLQKALCDRIYEKRKPAALQLEQIVRRALEARNMTFVDGIIAELSRDFAYALRHPNYRNGGLIGLAAVAIALGPDGLPAYLDDIIQPILTCFGDADSRVRYYACESLYNVAKIAKGEILVYFNEIFDALCKLTADVEESVRTGANLVDQLLRDIVVESTSSYVFHVDKQKPQIPSPVEQPQGPENATYQVPSGEVVPQTNTESGSGTASITSQKGKPTEFTLVRFIPLLVERIYVMNSATRMFLVQWIMLLDSIPDLELVKYIPDFLGGLLQYLSDNHKEVRTYTKTCLSTLLTDLKTVSNLKRQPLNDASGVDASLYRVGQDTYISYPQIIDILLSKMDPSNDETRLVALDWISGILTVSPNDVLAKLSSLLVLLIPALSDDVPEIKEQGRELNCRLLEMIPEHITEIDSHLAVQTLGHQLENEGDKVTRLASLKWLSVLHDANKLAGSRKELLARLLSPLHDPSDEVVHKDMELIALIYRDADENEFQKFGEMLLRMFKENRQLFTSRGKFVFLQLCLLLNPIIIFHTFAGIASNELNSEAKSESTGDDTFFLLVIQNLNNILLTAPELHEFRTKLTQLDTKEGSNMFTTLFMSWLRSSVAVLALCLLAGAYEPASVVLQILAHQDLSVSTLIQIDRLVQFMEGPVFAMLRLDLLEPRVHPFLYKTLYGILMVLPQSQSFDVLQKRLHSVSGIANLTYTDDSAMKDIQARPRKVGPVLVNWSTLLQKFKETHAKNTQAIKDTPTEKVSK